MFLAIAAPAAWRGAAAATPLFARTTTARAAALLPASPLTIGLDSPSFQTLRARRNAYVDKTSAIADLLVGDEGMRSQMRAFFARPRKFGKTLTLDVAAELLAAGALPAGVAPWAGRVPVDVDAVFGGLAVHARLRRRDPSLRGLLERAHFVVKLGLGGAQTGTKLEGTIISQIAGVAGSAFGGALEATVRSAVTPSDALEMVVRAVPASVPVSLLVDEYDGAIIQDVSRGRWAAADDGMAALRSLFMATKAPDVGARIERCLVTGVARFTLTSLFSGANNFADMTESPSLTRALGFSEVEIRAVFPAELARLASTLGTDVDGAIAELARWYNGYSFDGVNSSFNPFPVLAALRAGAISERELEAASGTNWLSLTPGAVIEGLAQELRADDCTSMASVDVADLEAQRVRAVPLLLQTGLLSIVAGQPAQCRAPNEYARRSLQRMVSTALATSPAMLAPFAAALRSRDRAAFSTAAMLLLERIPRALFKRDSGGDVGPREAVYHAALYAALVSTAPPGMYVQIQAASLRGQADVIIRFAGAPHPAAWVIEVGLGATPAAKLPQARDYARALDEPDVYVCALVVMPIPPASVASGGAAVIMEWTRRVSGTWEPA